VSRLHVLLRHQTLSEAALVIAPEAAARLPLLEAILENLPGNDFGALQV